MSEEKDTFPYCGGCGHIYFKKPKVTVSEAKILAENDRCHYCHEDVILDAEREREEGTHFRSDDKYYYEYY